MDADLPSRYFASPTVADLDGDGQSEIIMGNMLQNKVEIYNSSKQQISGWPQPVGGNINAAATVTNLDGDDDLDLVTTNRPSSTVSVLLNNSDGTFADQTLFDVGVNPVSVAAGDLDGDGDMDVATANIGSNNVSVLMNEGINSVENGIVPPNQHFLLQNYPNPFNAATRIKFILYEEAPVELTVFDLLGRKVRTLGESIRQAGIHTVYFNASDLSSGIYFYRLQAGELIETRRMILLK